MTKERLIELLSLLPEGTEINDLGISLEDEGGHKIHIYPPSIVPLTWSVEDFEAQAESLVGENWRDIYDESKFEDALFEMIDNHDAEWGINWSSISFYLNQYCKKEEENEMD